MLTASLLTAAFANPSSSLASGNGSSQHSKHSKHRQHGDLHRKKHRLDRNIRHKSVDLDEISRSLVHAQSRVDAARVDLATARSALADVQAQVQVAAVRDRQLERLLAQAVVRLHNAQSDLSQGTLDVQSQRAALASYAVSSYQTGGSVVLNIGVAFDAQTPQQALEGMQASATVLDKQAVSLQLFQATQVLLRLTEQRVQATKDDVAVKRQDAADMLQSKIVLQQQASAAKQDVVARLAAMQHAKQKIIKAKSLEKRHIALMQRERSRVQSQLKQLAERRARQYARAHANAPTFIGGSSQGGGYLSYPVRNTYITSPYGMRMHPILHIWELHDGTDFHALCGTPVYAAASGRVLSEYYNAGYGNRLILDHGFVRGVSLQTSYNHLTSYVARPGHQVQRGQLIAYSGTTGYSTGCHLHFMVYVNGNTVNPVNWL